jgi:hypothetical protein
MIRFGIALMLANTAGIALAILGYMCVRDGHEGFAIAFMTMAYCTIAVPKGSISLSTTPKSGTKSEKEKEKNGDGK